MTFPARELTSCCDKDLLPVTRGIADMAARCCMVLAGCLSVIFCVTVLRPAGHRTRVEARTENGHLLEKVSVSFFQ